MSWQPILYSTSNAFLTRPGMYLYVHVAHAFSGIEKKTNVPDRDTNVNTAFHEAGHTLVAYYTEDAMPVHKVTILQRGPALGIVRELYSQYYHFSYGCGLHLLVLFPLGIHVCVQLRADVTNVSAINTLILSTVHISDVLVTLQTSFTPEKMEYGRTRAQLLAGLDVAMGGRVGEEIKFGKAKVRVWRILYLSQWRHSEI